jgi:predicted P-loop ATPase/GTPase
MRTGAERTARRALETAFKVDPWNVVTFNLLALLDTLDKFDTIR